MLTKLLFTAITIFLILVMFKVIKIKPLPRGDQKKETGDSTFLKPSKWVLYSVIIVLLMVASVFGVLKWRADNTVITIHVVSAEQENPAVYQALRKKIKGRTFTTLDGRLVTLGDSDRIEIIEK